jgi:hypothetical protein
MKLQRDDFLQALESVQPGLAPREGAVDQSTCFVFLNGDVCTFNDEVSVRCPSKMDKKFSAAVPSKALVEQLRKWKEDEIDVEANGEGLIVKGKGSRKAVFITEKEITLPIEHVEKPKKWTPLPEDFGDAIKVVAECAKDKDESLAVMCLSLHPNFIEASDNFQLTRYQIKTGISKFCLVRKEAMKHLPSLDMTEMSETEGWLHFRNPAGVVYSARKNYPPEDYPDWSAFLKPEGKPATLPKGLAEAAEKAAIFSAENGQDNNIAVQLKEGKLRVKGQGTSGWFQEVKQINYKGPALAFLVSPKLLIELVKRFHEALISENKLRVDTGKFVSVICLERMEK